MSGDVVTRRNALRLGPYAYYKKIGITLISTFTVPPNTPFETPEGLKADDEPCRIAFDIQGGVYPIRESVFSSVYVLADDD